MDVLYVVIAVFAYFLPSIVAGARKHRSKAAILALNVLLGWTALGWIFAFIWSLTGNVEPAHASATSSGQN